MVYDLFDDLLMVLQDLIIPSNYSSYVMLVYQRVFNYEKSDSVIRLSHLTINMVSLIWLYFMIS